MYKVFIHANTVVRERQGLYALHQQSHPLLATDLPYIDRIGCQKYPVTCSTDLISMIVVPCSDHHKAKHLAAATYRMLKKENIDNIIIIAQAQGQIFHGIALPIIKNNGDVFDGFVINNMHLKQLAEHSLFHYHESAYQSVQAFQPQIQLIHYYLDSSVKITPLVVGRITHENAAEVAEQIALLSDERTLVVISADMTSDQNSVYQGSSLYYPLESIVYDVDSHVVQMIQGVPAGASDMSNDYVCNRNAYILLLKILEQSKFKNIQSYFVGYDTSVDSLYQNRVESFAAFIYQQANMDGYKNVIGGYEQSQLSKIAQRSLYAIFEPIVIRKPCMISYEMTQPHGAFVSLYAMSDHGRLLRGCMGQVQSTIPLHETIADMAEQAACRDARYYTLTHQELKLTLISISIVMNLQPVINYSDITHTDGIWFKYDDRSAISLPSPFSIQNRSYQEMLTDACFQAGVALSAWHEPQAKIFTFQSLTFQAE